MGQHGADIVPFTDFLAEHTRDGLAGDPLPRVPGKGSWPSSTSSTPVTRHGDSPVTHPQFFGSIDIERYTVLEENRILCRSEIRQTLSTFGK